MIQPQLRNLNITLKETKFFALTMVSLAVLTACQGDPTVEAGPKHKSTDKKIEKGVENDKLFATVPDRTLNESIKMYMGGANHKFDERSYLKAAKKAYVRDDYNSAILLANEALKLNPNSAEGFFYRGRAKYDTLEGNDDAVLKDLNRSIDLGINNEDAYRAVATIYDTRKMPQKAVAALTRGISVCKTTKNLYRARASLFVAMNQPEKAMADYDHLIKETPQYPRILVHRGQLHESLGQNEKALKDFADAARFDHDKVTVRVRPIALKLHASLLTRLGRYKEAIKVLDEAQKEDQMDDELHRFKGDAHAALKEYDKAIEEYNWAIDLAPQFSRHAYEARSKVYDKLGKKDLAEKDRQTAKSLKAAPAEKPIY